MLGFFSIASNLQVKIVEKMDYKDQMEFELSSKRAAQTMALEKRKPVFDVYEIGINQESEIYFQMIVPNEYEFGGDRREHNWSKIRRMQCAPRLRVTTLNLWGNSDLQTVVEFTEQADFCENEVELFASVEHRNLEIVDKLAQTFNITTMRLHLNPEVFLDLPWFRNLKTISMDIDSIPDERHVQLMASLSHCFSLSRLCSLSNQFFQQWVRRRRSIEDFSIARTSHHRGLDLNEILNRDTLLNGLSFTKVNIDTQSSLIGRMKDGSCITYMDQEDEYYVIHREDLKLLICVRYRSKIIQAHEVTEVFFRSTRDILEEMGQHYREVFGTA